MATNKNLTLHHSTLHLGLWKPFYLRWRSQVHPKAWICNNQYYSYETYDELPCISSYTFICAYFQEILNVNMSKKWAIVMFTHKIDSYTMYLITSLFIVRFVKKWHLLIIEAIYLKIFKTMNSNFLRMFSGQQPSMKPSQ